jgi:hypothetical protein
MSRRFVQIALIAGAVMLAGCAGGGNASRDPGSSSRGTQFVPALSVPIAHRDSHFKNVLFVSDLDSNVMIYTADVHESNPPLLGEITQGITRSQSLWVDRHGTLYVLNSGDHPNVVEYKRGTSTPFKTISTGLRTPAFVAADGAGNLYVTDNSNGNLVVLVYAKGASSPTQTIVLPSARSVGKLAFDPQGNLLVATSDFPRQSVFHVYSIPPGSSQVTDLGLQQLPGAAIATDRAGNLYVGGPQNNIAVYPPGSKTPSRTLSAPNEFYYGGITASANGTVYGPTFPGPMNEFAPGAVNPTNIVTMQTSGSDAAVATSW